MSPTIAVPLAMDSSIARSTDARISGDLGSGRCRRAAMTARNLALAEDRIPQNLVVHVATLGDESRVLDVADDLRFVHAVAGAGGTDDVFLDHDAAHVVGAVSKAQLTHLAALRHPRRLEVV